MLEMIAAGVLAHTIYHKAASVVHDENEIHHVEVSQTHRISSNNVKWQFEVCNPRCGE